LSQADASKRSVLGRTLSGALLSAASLALVVYSASAEPFVSFQWSEFALNVGLGLVIFLLFASWGVACVRSLRKAPRRSLGSVLLGACVLWTAVNLFYLGSTIYGYGQDMTNPRLRALR